MNDARFIGYLLQCVSNSIMNDDAGSIPNFSGII